jgi:glyoxylase-like metal-dependent hydrolase (beta-lactamase superfamily II)
LPGGDYATLIDSIRRVLFAFGDDAEVFPGHGPATTIGRSAAAILSRGAVSSAATWDHNPAFTPASLVTAFSTINSTRPIRRRSPPVAVP